MNVWFRSNGLRFSLGWCVVSPAVEGVLDPVHSYQVLLRCDVSGLNRTIWEIRFDEEAGKVWVYKPEFRSSTEYSATFPPSKVRLDRSTGAFTSDLEGLGAGPLNGICQIQSRSAPSRELITRSIWFGAVDGFHARIYLSLIQRVNVISVVSAVASISPAELLIGLPGGP
jgi:hypothetical protein